MGCDHVRVGIVGAGGNTKDKHIPLLQAIDGVEVISVCNRSTESSQAVAKAFNIPEVYEDWRSLVAADNIDAVVIGTWPNMHHDISVAALEAGKHVMCEARMARNAQEAESMLQAARSNSELICQVVPAPFTFAVDKTVQRLLAEHYIGKCLAIDCQFTSQQFLNRDAPLSWRQDRQISGNNIMALGICYESMMRWLGSAKRVTAMGQVYVKERKDDAGNMQHVDIPEHLDVIAEMPHGVQAHLRMSAIAGFAAENQYRIMGESGTIIIRGDSIFAAQVGDDALKEIDIPEDERGDWRVEEEFIAAIQGREAISHTTFEDGVRYMRFTDAVTASINTGQTVEIEPL